MKYILLLFGIFNSIISLAQCPSISKQPQSQIDCEGNSIRMIIETDAKTIQWEKKRPTDSNFINISGAASNNYQIYPSGGTSMPDGTIFRAKLSNGTCTIYSEEASISLNTITNITGTSICERANGTLQANFPLNSQNRALKFQWTGSVNGGPFQDLSNDKQFEGVNTPKLTIKNAGIENQGQKYKIRVDFEVSPNNDNDGSITNTNQSQTCPRTSGEVSITIKTSPAPIHSVKSYSSCIDSKNTVSSSGCSPYTTIWYNQAGEKIAEGARPSISFTETGIQFIQATCLKNGCESVFSEGVEVQVHPIPTKVSNAGTPEKIKEGGSITFKASGETNNIWYLNENDVKYISTASTLTVKDVRIVGTNPFYISRWVSQKINGCESAKSEIKVLIESENLPNPETNPSPLPQPEPSPSPDPQPSPEPNPLPTPDPIPTPEPDPIPEPVILNFDVQGIKNCDRESYLLKSTNCPSTVNYFDAINNEWLGSSSIDKSFELYTIYDRKIIAKCTSQNFTDTYQEFTQVRNPEVKAWYKEKTIFCPSDSMQLESRILFSGQFLYWEKNGHVYSTESTLKIPVDSARFDAVYTHNDCIYRSPIPPIIIRPRPPKPQLAYSRITFCPREKIEVTALEPALKYQWSNNSKDQKIIVQESMHVSLIVQNEYACLSISSDTVNFKKLEKGEKPILSTVKNQICEGDTSIIYSNLGEKTIWSNGQQKGSVEISESNAIFAVSKSLEGCISDTSDVIKIIKRPKPQQPKIEQPFNRILRGIRTAEDEQIDWQVDDHAIKVDNNEIELKNPSKLSLRTSKTYSTNGMNEITCKSDLLELKVNELNPYSEMSIYPNPNSTNLLFVNTPEQISSGVLEIIDLNGHQKWEKEIENRQNPMLITLPRLNPGIYFIRISSANYVGQKRLILLE